MGWTGCFKPGGVSPLAFILSEWEGEWMAKQGLEIVASGTGKGEVYIALKVNAPSEWERSVYETPTGSATVGVVYLFEEGSGPFGFRYKQMTECEGPYCSGSCPPSILSQLSPLKPNAPGFAGAWRKRQKANSVKEAA